MISVHYYTQIRPKRLNVVSASIMELLKADEKEQLKIIATGLKVCLCVSALYLLRTATGLKYTYTITHARPWLTHSSRVTCAHNRCSTARSSKRP